MTHQLSNFEVDLICDKVLQLGQPDEIPKSALNVVVAAIQSRQHNSSRFTTLKETWERQGCGLFVWHQGNCNIEWKLKGVSVKPSSYALPSGVALVSCFLSFSTNISSGLITTPFLPEHAASAKRRCCPSPSELLDTPSRGTSCIRQPLPDSYSGAAGNIVPATARLDRCHALEESHPLSALRLCQPASMQEDH